MPTDNTHCSNCGRQIRYILSPRAEGQYSDPEAEHKKDTKPEDRFLEVRWLSATSIRDRLKELAARCTYKTK
jgi:hypothetical protein